MQKLKKPPKFWINKRQSYLKLYMWCHNDIISILGKQNVRTPLVFFFCEYEMILFIMGPTRADPASRNNQVLYGIYCEYT